MPGSQCFCTNENAVLRNANRKLDKLLHQLDGFKPLLDQSAKCAANDIMANFEAVLSMLYNQRKVLLQQLEQVVRDKGDYIERQKQTIETLRIGVMSCELTEDELDHRVQDYIAKAEAVVFSTQSAPFVSFSNNNALLDQAIAAYGRIISRYCGHLANSSLPSACLPLEVEEEEEQEAFDSQSAGNCTCVDPSIRQWLLNPQCSGSCLVRMKKRDSETLQLTPSRPAYDLHTWLDQTKRPAKCFRRKLSNSFTTVDSDYSESHPLQMNYPVVGSTLREWLFADPMDTGDIPGFSKVNPSTVRPVVEVQPSPSNDIEDLYHWLSPLSFNSKEKKTLFTTVDDGFTLAGPAENVCAGDLVNESAETVSLVSVNSVEVVPVSNAAQDYPTPAMKETGSYDCIYSKCCGGPGGPTCCGGRPRPATVVMAPSFPTTISSISNTTVQAVGSVPSEANRPVITATGTPTSEVDPAQSARSAVVSQLTSIANSSLQQWLVSGSSNKSYQSPKFVSSKDRVRWDTSNWLMRSTTETSTTDCTVYSTSNWDDAKSALKLTAKPQLLARDYESWLSTKLSTLLLSLACSSGLPMNVLLDFVCRHLNLLPQTPRSLQTFAINSRRLPDPDCIAIYPLNLSRGKITLPPGLTGLSEGGNCQYRLIFPAVCRSEFQIPPTTRTIPRRAEHRAVHSRTMQTAHTSRWYIQHDLYKFAIQTCLGLHTTEKLASSRPLLVDLGAGNGHTLATCSAFLPIPYFCISIDLLSPNPEKPFRSLNEACSNRVIYDIVGSSRETSNPMIVSQIPLRTGSVDTVISISFLQWLTTGEVTRAVQRVNNFAAELGRILYRPTSVSGGPAGQCIFQFYPTNDWEVDLLCTQLTDGNPPLSGCRILARPVQNRGLKLFIYATVND